MPPEPLHRPPPAPWLRHHPSCWQAGTIDVPALSAASEALYRSPGFEQAIHHFALCWQQGYDSRPVLNSVMRNNARYVLLLACLWLDHVRDPARPEDSITPTRMLDFYRRIDHQLVRGGSSRIKTILGHVRSAGLLQPAAVGGDARRRPLEPTPALRHAMAGYVAGFLRGIAPVLPLPAAPETMVETPGFIGELFTYRLAGLLHERFSINHGLPAMTWVTNREKGYPQLLMLLRTLKLQPDGSGLSAGATQQQMADVAGLSRVSARNFLLGCVEQGWLAPRDGGGWVLLPGFCSQVLQWMGREFLWMHTLACAAWEVIRLSRTGSPSPAAGSSAAAASPGS